MLDPMPTPSKHHGVFSHLKWGLLRHLLKEVTRQLEQHGPDMLPEPYRALAVEVEKELKGGNYKQLEKSLLRIAKHVIDGSLADSDS